MITKEQYIEYKRLVDEYEMAEYESEMRKAEEELNFDDDVICGICGCDVDHHAYGCPEDNSPYAMLYRDGYD